VVNGGWAAGLTPLLIAVDVTTNELAPVVARFTQALLLELNAPKPGSVPETATKAPPTPFELMLLKVMTSRSSRGQSVFPTDPPPWGATEQAYPRSSR
jgi:hypothetical protein